jgi:hypothetical protein
MKLVAFSVVVVLLAGSSAFATGTLDQLQNTNIGLTETIQLLQGDQAASTIQNLAVGNDQHLDSATGGFACQNFLGNIAEVGSASGDSAIVGVLQSLSAVGMQAQLVGIHTGPKQEGQTLTLLADQGLVKSEGPGTGSALHTIILQEDQVGANTAGLMRESSGILGLQSSQLSGAPLATGIVDSSMVVSTVQTQAAL